MKGRAMLFGHVRGAGAAALVEDGRLADLFVDPPAGRIRAGAVYRAKAGRPMKGQGGMFLETPDGPLFLRQSKGVAPGETLVVQVTGYAEPGKAPPASPRPIFKSRFAIATPGAPGVNVSRRIRDPDARAALKALGDDVGEETGLILRSFAEGADLALVADDVSRVLDLARRAMSDGQGAPARLLDGPGAEELAVREWPRPDQTDEGANAFSEHGILDEIEALLRPSVELRAGASLSVETTRAFVAVDIDTGADTSPAAGLKANIAGLGELPRQLRLRGLGGQVVIDAAPVAKKDRVRVEQALGGALRTDPVETAVLGWTPLGLVELRRKRERCPLTECLS